MKQLRFFAVLLLMSNLLYSCGNKVSNNGSEKMENGERQISENISTGLLTAYDQVRLRDQAGERGEVIAELPSGVALKDLGLVSDFTTRLIQRGQERIEPWIKVETPEGKRGWVFAGNLRFHPQDDQKLKRFLEEKWLISLFGKQNVERMKLYTEAYKNTTTASGFSSLHQRGLNLRDTLVGLLQQNLTGPELPDLFWVANYFPGYMPQLVAEGTEYYLFIDYRKFLEKALKTTGPEDDLFMSVYCEVYPQDTIEYFFPGWMIQMTDYTGHSLLGRGIHLNIFDKMNQVAKQTDLFKEPLKGLKAELMNDITRSGTTYWENKDHIITELDSIIASDYHFLTEEDKVALKTRRNFFEEPEANGIELGYRSGALN